MTKESDSWSPVDETRDWQAVTDRSKCPELAKKRSQELEDIKRTKDKTLPWACIFGGKKQ